MNICDSGDLQNGCTKKQQIMSISEYKKNSFVTGLCGSEDLATYEAPKSHLEQEGYTDHDTFYPDEFGFWEKWRAHSVDPPDSP
jgi:hypothetical protein